MHGIFTWTHWEKHSSFVCPQSLSLTSCATLSIILCNECLLFVVLQCSTWLFRNGYSLAGQLNLPICPSLCLRMIIIWEWQCKHWLYWTSVFVCEREHAWGILLVSELSLSLSLSFWLVFSLSVCNGCISSCSPSLQHHSNVPSSSINFFLRAREMKRLTSIMFKIWSWSMRYIWVQLWLSMSVWHSVSS